MPLASASQGIEHVTMVDLYREYPTLRINIDTEQQRLRDHDVIIFMFPLYWYSTPSILKEWRDPVLEYGFAFGKGGTELHGKTFFCAITAGGPQKAYRAEGYNHYTIFQLLHPIEQTASLTGMTYLPPFALYGSRTAVEDNRVQAHTSAWQRLLNALIENRVDTGKAKSMDRLNDDLNLIIKDRT